MFKPRLVILVVFVCASVRAQSIVTVAGGGSNDGQLAALFSIAFDSSGNQLNFPNGVAVDASGIIYIADTDNDRVRTVSPLPTRRRAVRPR